MAIQEHAIPVVADPAPLRESSLKNDLHEIIAHAAHLLPAQGPITAFVHHNTLHAFEDLPFHGGVQQGAKIFDCEPYMTESKFHELLKSERIQVSDLRAVLLEDLGDRADGLIGRLGTRFHLRLAMLQTTLQTASGHELKWLLAETDALSRFRPETPAVLRKRMIDETRHWVMRDLRQTDTVGTEQTHLRDTVAELLGPSAKLRIENWNTARWERFCLHFLWRICRQRVPSGPSEKPAAVTFVRHRDALLHATGEDSDQLVHQLLIPLCAAFLDQGLSNWRMPHRAGGFYQTFLELYRQQNGTPDRWRRGLGSELRRLSDSNIGPHESIAESIEHLGVGNHEREQYLSESLLALRGWAGMIWQTETRGDRVAHRVPAGSLVEYVAVRLILERFALAHIARSAGRFTKPLSELRDVLVDRNGRTDPSEREQRVFQVFQLAQYLGWSPQTLHQLKPVEWSLLLEELDEFSNIERRRVFQNAYERRYRIRALDAVVAHTARIGRRLETPKYQVVCCIDEREESFRRHLEEVADTCETLGAAGFYGVAMYHRGAGDAHFSPLCPAVMQPRHYVQEDVVYSLEDIHRRRAKTRHALGSASLRWHIGSRSFFGGIFTALFGALASVPLVARILFPRLTARLREICGRFVQPPPVTQLQLERSSAEPGSERGQLGFSLDEMAGIVDQVLRDMGLTQRLSDLVIIVGHGSASLNNPHEAAHDCGACGGARGGPNARAFAQIANDPRVRALVAEAGLRIPPRTVFVGAYHNTCDDAMTYFDLDRLSATHRELFQQARQDIDTARERSAHERSRRFDSAPLNLTTEAALRHVEGRAEDLAQTRPEYGHCTNALSFVGRRSSNRGLFLDRRAFLTSYDPHQDDEDHSILTRVLQAVIPVCAGISLEYYFSFVDSTGYGCGTKLPHNIASLLGVMDGASSDLRTGLPWQMVEIHEPMRLLFIIETTPEAMLAIMDRDATIGRLCRNRWVQIATQNPSTAEVQVFQNGQFETYRSESTELPAVPSSIDWYRGWRDHLGFASVGPTVNVADGNGHPPSESPLTGSGATSDAS